MSLSLQKFQVRKGNPHTHHHHLTLTFQSTWLRIPPATCPKLTSQAQALLDTVVLSLRPALLLPLPTPTLQLPQAPPLHLFNPQQPKPQ